MLLIHWDTIVAGGGCDLSVIMRVWSACGKFCELLPILTSAPIFDHAYPIITEITFSFTAFASACKKSFHSINSFLRYSQF